MQVTDAHLRIFGLARVKKENENRINSLDFHRSEDYLATASDDDRIFLYDIQKGEKIGVSQSQKYGASCITFSHHPSHLLHASLKGNNPNPLSNHAVRYLNINSNQYVRYYQGHTDRVTSLTMSPLNDVFMSGGADKMICMWDTRTPDMQGKINTSTTPCVAFDNQGLIFATTGEQGVVKLYDAKKYTDGPFGNFVLPSEQASQSLCAYLKFSNDGRRLIAVFDNRVHVLDAFEGNIIATYSSGPDENFGPIEASFSPCGQYIFLGGQDRALHVWNIDANLEVCRWTGHAAVPTCVKFAPRRAMVASACWGLAMWVPDLRRLGEIVAVN